jgi:hypothetical protein
MKIAKRYAESTVIWDDEEISLGPTRLEISSKGEACCQCACVSLITLKQIAIFIKCRWYLTYLRSRQKCTFLTIVQIYNSVEYTFWFALNIQLKYSTADESPLEACENLDCSGIVVDMSLISNTNSVISNISGWASYSFVRLLKWLPEWMHRIGYDCLITHP